MDELTSGQSSGRLEAQGRLSGWCANLYAALTAIPPITVENPTVGAVLVAGLIVMAAAEAKRETALHRAAAEQRSAGEGPAPTK